MSGAELMQMSSQTRRHTHRVDQPALLESPPDPRPSSTAHSYYADDQRLGQVSINMSNEAAPTVPVYDNQNLNNDAQKFHSKFNEQRDEVHRQDPEPRASEQDYSTSAQQHKDDEPRERMLSASLATLPKEKEIMEPHDSFHGEITGKEAEFRLKKSQKKSYLTRYSEQNELYVLSVCYPYLSEGRMKFKIKHFEIKFRHEDSGNTYQIADEKFNSLAEMLQEYEQKMIDHAQQNIGSKLTEDDYHRLEQNKPPPLTPREFTQQSLNPNLDPPNAQPLERQPAPAQPRDRPAASKKCLIL